MLLAANSMLKSYRYLLWMWPQRIILLPILATSLRIRWSMCACVMKILVKLSIGYYHRNILTLTILVCGYFYQTSNSVTRQSSMIMAKFFSYWFNTLRGSTHSIWFKIQWYPVELYAVIQIPLKLMNTYLQRLFNLINFIEANRP